MLHRSLDSLPDEPVSHNPKVRKRVWVKSGEIPNLTQVSRAVLPPGEVCGAHSHDDMWEMFVVQDGAGWMIVDGKEIGLKPGDCLLLSPGESHELVNSPERPLILLTIGWTTRMS